MKEKNTGRFRLRGKKPLKIKDNKYIYHFVSVLFFIVFNVAYAEIKETTPRHPGLSVVNQSHMELPKGAIDPYGLDMTVFPHQRTDITQEALPWPDVLDTVLNPPGGPQFPRGDTAVEIPNSFWFQQEKKQYSDFLAGQKFDILVMPFQVQHFGIDRIGRSIMTAELTYELSRLTNMRIPDPYLVTRAMGEGMRRYSSEETLAFADRLGVRQIVSGYVGHDRKGKMKLTIQIRNRKKESKLWSKGKEIGQYDWTDLPFADAELPMQVFHQLLPEIFEKSGLAVWKPFHAEEEVLVDMAKLKEPLQMQSINSKRLIEKARYLTLLGMMAPKAPARTAERIFERVLITLNLSSDKSKEIRLMRARALLHLHRRPAALQQLEGLSSPESQGLTAILNGNLTGLSDAIKKVKSPMHRLLLAIEGNDLAHKYTRKSLASITELIDPQFIQSQAWRLLLQLRFDDPDIWSVSDNGGIKGLMDEAFPIKGYSLQDIISGQQVTGNTIDYSLNVALSPIRHLRKMLTATKDVGCCPRVADHAGNWDYINLLEGIATSNLLQDVKKEAFVLGRDDIAQQTLDKYDVIYAGHPEFVFIRATLALRQMQATNPHEITPLKDDNLKHSVLVAFHEQGQSPIAQRALINLGIPSKNSIPFIQAYVRDFPMRKFWHPHELPDDSIQSQHHQNVINALRYSDDDPLPAYELISSKYAEKHNKEVRDLVAGRFAGNADAAKKLSKFLHANSQEPIEQVLRKAIELEPNAWDNYKELGTILIEKHGDYAQAAKLYMSFPPFTEPDMDNSVALSNRAYRVGLKLLRLGQIELAKPLFKIAASYNNGSGASMFSAYYIAMFDHQYNEAAQISLRNAQRYDSTYAYRDYLSLLHVLGYSDEAWPGFMQLLNRYKNPQVWVSALVGHRKNAKRLSDYKGWLLGDTVRNAKSEFFRSAAWYAILWSLVDRGPNDELVSIVSKIEEAQNNFIDASGRKVVQPREDECSGCTQAFRRSKFRLNERKKLKPGTKVETGLEIFSKAYVALKKGEHKGAMMLFDKLASLYAIENGDMSFALPYFAYVSAKSGDPLGLHAFISGWSAKANNFNSNLSLAFFSGLNNKHDDAEKFLDQAFNKRTTSKYRPIFTEYQYAEACIWLFKETGHDGYRRRALKWARQYQQIKPTHSWAYALEAAFSKDEDQRIRAAAFTLYLDKNSEWLKSVPGNVLESARVQLKTKPPFQDQIEEKKAEDDSI